MEGKILQLGRQQVYLTMKQIKKFAAQAGVKVPDDLKPSPSFDPDFATLGYVDDVTLFKALGFDAVESLDLSEYEDCSFAHDLNEPIPEKYHGQYDVIYDGGTLEHVFHFPNCLKNIHHMLKPNGIIIHASPSHNHVDHGFYMFSPTVYADYYAANKYKTLKSNIFEYDQNHEKNRWTIYDYSPGSIDHLAYGGWGSKLLGIWFVAEKTKESTCNVIPQQSFYKRTWNPQTAAKINPLKQLIKRHKVLYLSAKLLKRLLPLKLLKNKKPPVAAIY